MRFKGLDLNLFAAFEALMETRNTARAGEILGLSQPATSAALARLRDYFSDELLAVKGRRMYPTPLAESLLPKVRECLRSAEAAMATSGQFEPRLSDRIFRIASSDYIAISIFAPLARTFLHSAPRIGLSLFGTDEHTAEALRRGEVDLVISPAEHAIPGIPADPILDEDFVLAGWSEHPIFREEFAIEQVFRYGHVAVALGRERTTVGDHLLETLGYRRSIEVTTASFTMVPWLLEGTHRLAIMHRRLASEMSGRFALRTAELPFAVPPLREFAQYHETRKNDPGVRWLVDQIRLQGRATSRQRDD